MEAVATAPAAPCARRTGALPRLCPLCGGGETAVVCRDVQDYEYGAPGTYQWLRCTGCGLIRLDPVPTAAILDQAYPPHYHAYTTPRSAITRRLLAGSRMRAARSLARSLPDGASILDVGCSTGLLLEAVRRVGRFRLFGVEYKPDAAEQARRGGIEVWTGELENADVPAGSMDLVIMQHVLEHVPAPIETLRRVRAILRPGGRLVGELPSFDSWDARLFGRYWGGGHAPRHLFHFTPASLTAALQHCGYTDVRIRPALHTGHWALSIQHLLRRGRTDTAGLASGRSRYYPFMLLLTVPINTVQMALGKTGIIRFEARTPA